MKYGGICILSKNVPAMAAFYKNALQAEIHGDNEHFDIIVNGGCVTIWNNGNVKDTPNANMEIQFQVDDINAEFNRIKRLGAEVFESLTDHPWGWSSFTIFDPDKNKLRFAAETKKE